MTYVVAKNPTLVTRPDEVPAVIDTLFDVDVFSLDVETTSLVKTDAELHGIALATDEQEWYVTLDAVEPFMGYCQPLFDVKTVVMHNQSYDLPFFLWRGITFNDVFDTMIAQWTIDNTQDIGLKDLAINKLGAPYDLPDFSEMQHMGKRLQSVYKGPQRKVTSITMRDIPLDISSAYAMRDGRYTVDLYHLSVKELQQLNLWDVYHNYITPLSEVLISMEMFGMHVDPQLLNDLDSEYTDRIRVLNEMWEAAVGNVNYNSNKQLPYLLYGHWVKKKETDADPPEGVRSLGFRTDRLTKAGNPSTDALSLIRLRAEYRLAPPIVEDTDDVPIDPKPHQWWFGGCTTVDALAKEYKHLKKLYHPDTSNWNSADVWEEIEIAFASYDPETALEKQLFDCHKVHPLRILRDVKDYQKLHKTYVKGIIYSIRERGDGTRVYGNFNQTGTATGRLSASGSRDNDWNNVGVNLQNIPARGTGASVRRLFNARPGHSLLVVDYSQLELRLLAHFAARFAEIKNKNAAPAVDNAPHQTLVTLKDLSGDDLIVFLRGHADIYRETCLNKEQADKVWNFLKKRLEEGSKAYKWFHKKYQEFTPPKQNSSRQHKIIEAHLLNVFLNDGDPHQMTADKAGIARTYAKRVNFGWAYGVGPKALCDQIEEATEIRPTMAEAKQWLKGFAKAYPECIIWKKAVIEKAKEYGFVRTIAGRILWLHNINSPVQGDRAQDERRAVNYIIQGSAADVMNLAMFRIHKFLRTQHPSCVITGQVHDEIVIEGPTAELKSIEEDVKEIMRDAGRHFNLLIELDVDGTTGDNWYEAK